MKPWEVRWLVGALRDLRRLDRALADRILEALGALAEEHRGDVRKLKGETERWRLRVGDYRVIFTFDDDSHAIVVLEVRHRGEAYRR